MFEKLIKPQRAEIPELIKQGNCIPVFLQIPADLLTPVSAFLKIGLEAEYGFLFESASSEKSGRYSFVGCNPYKVLSQNNCDPLIKIEEYMKQVQYVTVSGLPSFTGGAIGYVGFDCIHYFEPSTSCELEDKLHIPDSIMMFCNELIVFDHFFATAQIVSHLRVDSVDSLQQIYEKYDQTLEKIQLLLAKLQNPETPLPNQGPINMDYKSESNIGQSGYESFVKSLKVHIKKGDIIQAVPSQRVARPTDLHPFNVYRKLRNINPSPYMFYVHMKDFELVGASPEALVKVSDGYAETHPIAGTRKRGKTPQEDLELEKELLSDEKERAEHIMLVDLGRNDVNRICEPTTVRATRLMEIERYSHVMHIVSHVSGKLRSECTPFDAFRAIFPAGTVSGAPKIRAIQLINGLEKIKRNFYAGAVGWFSFNGDLDCCIALRTIMMKDGVAFLQAGGGIVYDSDPTDEFEETINKMNSNVAAISRAEEYFSELKGF